MDILEAVAIELPCPTCGKRYGVNLKQILLSKAMLHEGCPVPIQYSTECSPLNFSDLVECGLIQELEQVWCRLEKRAEASGGKLIISNTNGLVAPKSSYGEK
jgi:hypothetical protein